MIAGRSAPVAEAEVLGPENHRDAVSHSLGDQRRGHVAQGASLAAIGTTPTGGADGECAIVERRHEVRENARALEQFAGMNGHCGCRLRIVIAWRDQAQVGETRVFERARGRPDVARGFGRNQYEGEIIE
jgi:hypothetical protein